MHWLAGPAPYTRTRASLTHGTVQARLLSPRSQQPWPALGSPSGFHVPLPPVLGRYVCENTVEERVLALQEAKAALGKAALVKQSVEEARAARLADLRILLDVASQ